MLTVLVLPLTLSRPVKGPLVCLPWSFFALAKGVVGCGAGRGEAVELTQGMSQQAWLRRALARVLNRRL